MSLAGRGRISQSGLTQDIKMGSCVFQCDVPDQWIAQPQVGHVSILWQGGVSHPVSVAWHSCVAAHWSKYHCYKQTPSRYDLRCLKATLNPNKWGNKCRESHFNPTRLSSRPWLYEGKVFLMGHYHSIVVQQLLCLVKEIISGFCYKIGIQCGSSMKHCGAAGCHALCAAWYSNVAAPKKVK